MLSLIILNAVLIKTILPRKRIYFPGPSIMMAGVSEDLRKLADPERAKLLSRFFKTGKGEYGEGDVFIGLTMPEIRSVAKKHENLSIKEAETLLHSKIHEFRMAALVIWTCQYAKADDKGKEKIYNAYMRNLKWINNWDLVDVTTPRIVGRQLLGRDRSVLYRLAGSKNLWERRVAVLATFAFIDKRDFNDSLKIAEILLNDKHKAVGWMLREIGKRDQKVEERFLDKHSKEMPRTMLRYAIEKFDEKKRKHYMAR